MDSPLPKYAADNRPHVVIPAFYYRETLGHLVSAG